MGREGGLACKAAVDFRKACDTFDRFFLFRVMEAAGAGEDLIHWIRTLLNNTMATACVNGHTSNLHLFGAGIRQGGESPGVYIFIAWALNLLASGVPSSGSRGAAQGRPVC